MVVNPLAVVVGEHDITSSEDGTEHAVCRTVSHPNYNSPSQLNNDFAILHLSTPVQIGTRAAPACLATTSMAGDFLAEKPLTVSGWGALQEGQGGPGVLHSVDVPGVTNAVCNEAYNGAITDKMLCAGEPTGGIDSCQGDSGGKRQYYFKSYNTILYTVISIDKKHIFLFF